MTCPNCEHLQADLAAATEKLAAISVFLSLKYCEQANTWSGTVPHTDIMSGGPDELTAIKATIDAAGLVIEFQTSKLATATARVKWLEEGKRHLIDAHLFPTQTLPHGWFALVEDWLAAEPKEQG